MHDLRQRPVPCSNYVYLLSGLIIVSGKDDGDFKTHKGKLRRSERIYGSDHPHVQNAVGLVWVL
jgi:hypothetical protein